MFIVGAVQTAQSQKPETFKEGVYYVEFNRALAGLLKDHLPLEIMNSPIPSAMAEEVFLDVYETDAFYSNKDFTQFSSVELEGFKKWSVWEKENFEGYKFN